MAPQFTTTKGRSFREAKEQLIGDFERKLVHAFGVARDDVAGYSGMARRTVFVIDGEGVITWTWITSPEQRQPDYDLVIEEARQAAAKSKS